MQNICLLVAWKKKKKKQKEKKKEEEKKCLNIFKKVLFILFFIV